MPLYEYQCQHCGKSCELLQKVSEAPAIKCPDCGKDQLKRQVSAPRFQLKGTGWYVTDFKNQDKKNPAASTTKDGTASHTEDKKPAAEPPKTSSEEKS